MDTQQQIAEIWTRLIQLEYEVNNVIKNDAGNIRQAGLNNTEKIGECSDAIDEIIIAITPTGED